MLFSTTFVSSQILRCDRSTGAQRSRDARSSVRARPGAEVAAEFVNQRCGHLGVVVTPYVGAIQDHDESFYRKSRKQPERSEGCRRSSILVETRDREKTGVEFFRWSLATVDYFQLAGLVAQWVRRRCASREVPGSNPCFRFLHALARPGSISSSLASTTSKRGAG